MASNENMANEDFNEGLDEEFLNLVGEDQPDESSEELGATFESILNEDGEGTQTDGQEQTEEETADTQETPSEQGTSEPGYVKKRVSEAVEKALARETERIRSEVRAEMQAEFDRKFAPIQAKLDEDEAQELVRSRKVTDIETARELVRLRRGQPAPAATPAPEEPEQQPRNDRGQFAPKQDDDTTAASTYLAGQAGRIKATTGIDVMAVFNSNAEIRNKVLSGEMDFRDVAEQMQKQQKRRPPAPMRSPNRTDGQIRGSIMELTDEQFARLEREVQKRG